jgi:hypothetical protein
MEFKSTWPKQQENKLVELRAHFSGSPMVHRTGACGGVFMQKKVIKCLGGRGKLQKDSTQIKGVGSTQPAFTHSPHAAEFAAKPNIIRTIMVGWVHIKTGTDLQQQRRLRWFKAANSRRICKMWQR